MSSLTSPKSTFFEVETPPKLPVTLEKPSAKLPVALIIPEKKTKLAHPFLSAVSFPTIPVPLDAVVIVTTEPLSGFPK